MPDRLDDRTANLSGMDSRNTEWERLGALVGDTPTYITGNNTALTATTAKADVLAASVPQSSITTGRFFYDPGKAVHTLLQFVGTDAEDEVAGFRVWSWRPQRYYNGDIISYSPTLMYDGTFTLGAETGIANGVVLNTEYYADTIAGTDYSGSAEILCNAADSKAVLKLDALGSDFIEVELSRESQTAALMGVLHTEI